MAAEQQGRREFGAAAAAALAGAGFAQGAQVIISSMCFISLFYYGDKAVSCVACV
jgi:hypothetical protein